MVADDLAAITQIYAHEVAAGTATFETEPPDQPEMARRFTRLREGGFPALVLCDDDGVAAFAYAAAFRERAAFRFTLEDSIYVAPRARGRGVGARLIHALVADSREKGFQQMVAVIGDSANAASIALHARAGFSAAGQLTAVGWKFGRWLDVVLMQRSI